MLLRRRARLGAVLAALVALAVIVSLGGGKEAPAPGLAPRVESEPAEALRVPYDGRSPRLSPGADEQRVLVALSRPALGGREDIEGMSASARRRYVRSLEQEAGSLRSALGARGVRLREVVTYSRVWNGFAATVRARDLARLTSLGVRTRPIRRFFPAISEPVGRREDVAAIPPGAPAVALLAGGTEGEGGYDAVDRDRDPATGRDPRGDDRAEVSGDALSRVLAAEGVRVVPVRVASLRPDGEGIDEHARTDELLAGLEFAVDPDGDGDPEDGVAVALVGVNAPYAGFADAPEAQAVAGARALGTTVVAPAGHEGSGSGPFGTVGSPGAARAAVTVGALAPPDAPATVELKVGGLRMRGAAVLAGMPPPAPLRSGAAGLAVVRAGSRPSTAVAEAVARGARAVVLAEPRGGRPLTALPAGLARVPVLGVTGAAARAMLALPLGLKATASAFRQIDSAAAPSAAPASSSGATFAGRFKPDLLAPGVAGGVAGTGVAAARVAAALARRAGSRSVGASRPLRTPTGERPARVPVGRPQLAREGGRVTGVRFTVGAFTRGEPLRRGATGTRILPVERLELALQGSRGGVVRRLTPAGGERGLLPGEYAYTVPRRVLRDLEAGRYRFVVRARGPRQPRPTRASSPSFPAP